MSALISQMHTAANQQGIEVGVCFEETIKVAYQHLIGSGDTVVDVGAHEGFHTIPMAKAVGIRGKVHAIEPLPHLARLLRKRVKRRLLFNTRIHEVALGNQIQDSTFVCFRQYPGYSGLARRKTNFSDQEGELEKIVVAQTTLDSIFPTSSKMSLIKLDIEGGELHALMGGRKTLLRSRPVIIFECGYQDDGDVYHYTKTDFFGFFESLDYGLFSLDGAPFTPANWHDHSACWELVALPEEKKSLAGLFPGFCRQAMSGFD